MDRGGTRATTVVEAVPGVPASTVASHLHEPGPDLFAPNVDRHGHRGRALAFGNQVRARIGPAHLLLGCTPVGESRTDREPVHRLGQPGRLCQPALNCHTANADAYLPS